MFHDPYRTTVAEPTDYSQRLMDGQLIQNHAFLVPTAAPPRGYRIRTIYSVDKAPQYAWQAPDLVESEQPYKDRANACRGAWNDYSAWQRAQRAA